MFSHFCDVMFPVESLVKVQPKIFDCFCLWGGVIPEVELGVVPFRSVKVTCVGLFSLIFSLHLRVHLSMLSR